MSDRYFVDRPMEGNQAVVGGPEAHHLIHVMRAKPGDQVTLFDGLGDEFAAEVRQVGRVEVQLTVLERRHVDREPCGQIVLGVAIPKGDRQKWLVEKAVEMGVGCLVPLRTARSVAQPVGEAVARLRRTVIEASKQCGRNRLMQIGEARDWAGFLAEQRAASPRWLAHPSSRMPTVDGSSPNAVPCGRSPSLALAVGPEGGFTRDEAASALAEGWTPIDLGPRILRTETAAIAMSVLAVQWLARSQS